MLYRHRHNPHLPQPLADILDQQGMGPFPLPAFQSSTPFLTNGGVFLCFCEGEVC